MDKIKIIYLAANPTDTSHLQLQEEARDLEERIRSGPHRDAFTLIHCLAVRPRDLLRVLQEVQPHILHFSGHGTANNEIVLQDDHGVSIPIAPQDLADLVRLFSNNLKLVLLSACFAHKQAETLHQVIDFTMGMNKPISDTGAVKFSAAFYQVLAGGGSVKQAFEGARLMTSMEGRPVFEKSDLLVREGANENQPFIEIVMPATAKPQNTTAQPKDAGGTHQTQNIDHSNVGSAVISGNGSTLDIKVQR